VVKLRFVLVSELEAKTGGLLLVIKSGWFSEAIMVGA
jgi:hypothetical protein